MDDIIYFSKTNNVFVLDQTLLPFKVKYVEAKNYLTLIKLIKRLSIRGAPAIGVAGAFAAFLALKNMRNKSNMFEKELRGKLKEIELARPTAINLGWAIRRFEKILTSNITKNYKEILRLFYKEAIQIYKYEKNVSQSISNYGSKLFSNNYKVLTHCNTGSLATTGPGTALGVIKSANKRFKNIKVFATETRPLLQGSRLTVWECEQENIDCTLITDSMASYVIKNKDIDCVIVGADRIAVNGDVANKIGTYQLAISCHHHKIPFYVAAPLSTFDFSCKNGQMIDIEQRNPKEITKIMRSNVSAANKVFNPAFDITPRNLISAIITEKGIIRKPNKTSIYKLKDYCC